MAASQSYQSSSLVSEPPTLLTLPLELRLHIYSYLLPATLSFNHCIHKSEARLPPPKGVPRLSPLKSYLISRHLISRWCRSHGLHLLSPRSPSKLREEFTAYFYHINPRLEVHCANGCLDQLLDHLIRHLCIARRFPLVREVWIRVDFDQVRRDVWDRSPNRTVRSLLKDFRQTVAKWYGHFGLLHPKDELPQTLDMDWDEDGQQEEGEREGEEDSTANIRRPEWINSSSSKRRGKWKQDEDEDGNEREYVLEYVRVIGKAPLFPPSWRRRKRKRGSHHGNGSEDEDDLHVIGSSSHAITPAQAHLDNLDTTDDDSDADDDGMTIDDQHYFDDDDNDDDDDDDDDENEDESDSSDSTNQPTNNNNVTFFIGGGAGPTTAAIGFGPSSSQGFSREYFRRATIEEIERRPIRYYIDRGGPRVRSRVMDKAMVQIYGARLAMEMEQDWWRRSSRLIEEKGERWVCREEVWAGCLF